MTRKLIAVWALTIAVSAVGIINESLGLVHARAKGHSALRKLDRFQRDSERLSSLRGRIPPCLSMSAPETPLAPRLHEALASVGVSPSTLASVAAQDQTKLTVKSFPQDAVVNQRIGLRLQDLTLPQLGSFLVAWRRTEPCWRIASIDITPASPGGRRDSPRSESTGGGGMDLPLHVGLALERLHLQHREGRR